MKNGSVKVLFGSAEILSQLLCSRTVERLNPSSAYARDFANGLSGEGQAKCYKKPSFKVEGELLEVPQGLGYENPLKFQAEILHQGRTETSLSAT